MIKLSIAELFKSFEVLHHLGNQELPVRLSFWVARATRMLKADYELYQKQKMDMLERYAVFEDNQLKIIEGQVILRNETAQEYIQEFNSFITLEVEVNILPISENELLSSNIKIAPQDLISLTKLIKED